MKPQEYMPLIVTAIDVETAGVKRITLAAQDGEILPYKAGQFISFALNAGNKEERRSYSFVSAPGVDKEMAIAVKRIDNGLFSRKLHDSVKIGDVLHSTGISGLFTLPADIDNYDSLFFFAAGIGITPVLSLIKSALHLHKSVTITLFYSNRNVTEAAFYDELNALAGLYRDRFNIVYFFSVSPHLNMARLSKELAIELVSRHKLNIAGSLFYICGPYAYMRMVTYALEEVNVPAANIRKENFDVTITRFKPSPADKDAHRVYLEYKGNNYDFTSQYPDTILQAAEKNGIPLPYSCRNGVCGSCAALCIKGKVWHSANEVLTDKELEKGMILTCVGYPVDGDVALSI